MLHNSISYFHVQYHMSAMHMREGRLEVTPNGVVGMYHRHHQLRFFLLS